MATLSLCGTAVDWLAVISHDGAAVVVAPFDGSAHVLARAAIALLFVVSMVDAAKMMVPLDGLKAMVRLWITIQRLKVRPNNDRFQTVVMVIPNDHTGKSN